MRYRQSIILVASLAYGAPACAYVGPGAGLPLVGMLIALVGAVMLAIVGFVWYPVKRLLRRRKKSQPGQSETEARSRDDPAEPATDDP